MKIGDTVEVIDPGRTYSTYEGMAIRLESSNWHRGFTPKKGSKGKIVNMDSYPTVDKKFVLICDDNKREFIIGGRGLKVLAPCFQLSEIDNEWKGLIDELL